MKPANLSRRNDLAPALRALEELIQTVHQLRAPGGCAWDRAQTHQSLRQYLIEEAYEVLDVLDRVDSPAALRDAGIGGAFKEELGDLLMQVLLHAEMTQEEGAFGIAEVADGLNEKLVRRHPHVFGEVKADNEETAFQMWEKQKAREKANKPQASVLDGVPKGLPGLQRASRVLEKVTKVGFQWSDMEGPIAKVDEELGELKAELARVPAGAAPTEEQKKKIEAELGDLLFTLANVGYLMKVQPEDALRGTLARFENRFRFVEKRLKEQGKLPENSTLEEMDRYWDEAKALERSDARK